jgi:hypothetical protein
MTRFFDARRTVLLIVALAWLSSVTMLSHWPPTTFSELEKAAIPMTNDVPDFLSGGAHESRAVEGQQSVSMRAVWMNWTFKLLFVVGGFIAAAAGLAGSRTGTWAAVGFSILYIGYWLSEYALARGTVASVVHAVAYQIAHAPLVTQIGVIQHQIVLPLLHMVCVGYFTLKGVRRS